MLYFRLRLKGCNNVATMALSGYCVFGFQIEHHFVIDKMSPSDL